MESTNTYFNAEAIKAAGLDPSPKAGDVVRWVENKVAWYVDEKDDLTGPTALRHWPDGGWVNVELMQRGSTRIPGTP